MRRSLPVAVVLVFTLTALLAQRKDDPNVISTKPLDPADELKAFKLPPGFEAQLVAAEPDIQKPLNLAFDDQGRLWVTDTREYPHPAKKGKKARDTVKILSDFKANGRAGKIVTFADELNIPIGVLPLPGAKPRDALVFSIPSIYRMRATGGDKADKREVFYEKFGTVDTHGMTNAFTLGFDGWVYACHGFKNRSTLKGAKGQPITMTSGNVYRMRPDGSALQQVTWGQVNPFGLTFDDFGNLYSSDCHTQPIYQLLRGAYYPSFGAPHDGLGFGPEMITNYRGSTAIAGIAYYSADQFPKEYQGSAFVGDVMTNQIIQFDLAWTGATPKAIQKVLLDSKDKWFRPVDIKLGPDGALYVADFYNCIIGHYEVDLNHPKRDRHRGRIWRIVYTGKGHKGTPAPRTDWTTAKILDLIGDLAHPNLTVRLLATNQLAIRDEKAVRKELRPVVKELLAGKKTAPAMRQLAQALWVLERRGGVSDEELSSAMKNGLPPVRAHVQHILAERAKWTATQRSLAVAALKDENAQVKKAAADALGQHPEAGNVRSLLDLRHLVLAGDTHLMHTVRMALRNQLRLKESWKKLEDAKLTRADNQAIADVALGTALSEAAHWLAVHLPSGDALGGSRVDQARFVGRLGDDKDVQNLVAFGTGLKSLREQVALWDAIHQGRRIRGSANPLPMKKWAETLVEKLLTSKDDGEVQLGAGIVGEQKLAKHAKTLVALANKGKEDVRRAALRGLMSLDAGKHAGTAGEVVRDATVSMKLREDVANLLAGANQDKTREQLLLSLPVAPARLQTTIAAGLARSKEGATKLLDAIAAGKASARLLLERGVRQNLQNAKPLDLAARLKKLTAGLPSIDAKIQALLTERSKSYGKAKRDPKRGAMVFEKNCAACHQIGGKGAKVGPQLDGIGLRGLDRLLEDVLDPSRNVDNAFRLTTIITKQGQINSGLVLREEGALVVLADNHGKEFKVAKKDIDKRVVSALSAMPANFENVIKENEFHDLMAYLLEQRGTKPK